MVNTNIGSYSRLDKEYRKFILISGADTGSELAVQTVPYGKSGTDYFPLLVDGDGKLQTTASVSVSTGSESFNYGKSGTGWLALSVDGNGVLNTNASVTAGSVSYIPAGSVIVTNTVAVSGNLGVVFDSDYVNVIQSGTNWQIGGSVYSTGSVNIVNSLNGSFAITTNPVPISGDVIIKAGSVQTYSPVGIGSVLVTNTSLAVVGSQYISNLTDLGSSRIITAGSVVVTNTPSVTQGTNPWIVLGSTQITNSQLAISGIVSSNTTVIAGSIQIYNPVGIGSVLVSNGSVNVYGNISTSAPSVGKDNGPVPTSGDYIAGNYNGSLFPLRIEGGSSLLVVGSIRQLTDPWVVLGSQYITNLTDLGSNVVVKAGSIQTYSPLGVGSVLVTNDPLPISGLVTIKAGSVQVYNPVGIGSILITNPGSVIQSTNPWIVLGSAQITNTLLATSGATAKPIMTTGSVPTTSGFGSCVKSLYGMMDMLSMIGVNSGSTYQFMMKDSEGYLRQAYTARTGDFVMYTNIPVSGDMIFFVSGAQANGNYNFLTSVR